jgi:hypothetical protein
MKTIDTIVLSVVLTTSPPLAQDGHHLWSNTHRPVYRTTVMRPSAIMRRTCRSLRLSWRATLAYREQRK